MNPGRRPSRAIWRIPRSIFNRELSWLAFNERVLAEVCRAEWPLLERVKFLAIYFSNLDEFFMIRVSGLHEQLEAALKDTTPDGLSPREQLTRIGQLVRRQEDLASWLYADVPALAAAGLHVRDWRSLDVATQQPDGPTGAASPGPASPRVARRSRCSSERSAGASTSCAWRRLHPLRW